MTRAAKCLWVLLMLAASPCGAADLSAQEVRAILAAATSDKPADLSGKSLEYLDLSNLDFKRANLLGATLFGAKLDGANLSSGANFTGAKNGRRHEEPVDGIDANRSFGRQFVEGEFF